MGRTAAGTDAKYKAGDFLFVFPANKKSTLFQGLTFIIEPILPCKVRRSLHPALFPARRRSGEYSALDIRKTCMESFFFNVHMSFRVFQQIVNVTV